MAASASQSRRTGSARSWQAWLAAGLVILVLLLAVIVAGLYATGRKDVTYPPDSPEAAYQGYLHAWDSGDLDAAYAVLTADARSRVPEREFRQAHRWSGDAVRRVWIDEISRGQDQVTLVVTLESTDPGFLHSERYREQTRILMIREDGVWKIDTPLVGYLTW